MTIREHDAVLLENRHLRVLVSLSRGGEIFELRDKRTDIDLLWHHHAAVTSARPFIATSNRAEGSFLDHFAGGWQEIFPSGGPATEFAGAEFGQHGEVALLPWSCEIQEDEPESVSVHLSVRCRRYPFRLDRWLTINDDRAVLRVQARATNLSPMDLPVMWGHHITFGHPFVSESLRLLLPPETPTQIPETLPTDSFTTGVGRWPLASSDPDVTSEDIGSIAGAQNHVFVGPVPVGHATLVNTQLDLGATVTWDADVLPHVWCWSVNGGARAYPLFGAETLLTLEPFTSPFLSLAEAASSGHAPFVSGNASIDHGLQLGLSSASAAEEAAVAAFAANEPSRV